jgi:hypothetical protein
VVFDVLVTTGFAAMTNPFPGFNPFLELPAYWPDFHTRFVNYWCEAVAEALPYDYEASIGERVYLVEKEPDRKKLVLPDISLLECGERNSSFESKGNIATLEPVTIPVTILDGPRESYIEILYQPDKSLVTTLELLSPTNKFPPGRAEYLSKRNSLMKQAVHLVELDLLRTGERLPFAEPLPEADYYYIVSDYEQRPDCQVYSWNIAQALPTLPIPLRSPDSDIFVSLAEVFKTAFERGRFERRIDYRQKPPGTWNDAASQWLHDRLSSQDSTS